MKNKVANFKKQKKLFSKTAGNENVKAINSMPRPTRGGFRGWFF